MPRKIRRTRAARQSAATSSSGCGVAGGVDETIILVPNRSGPVPEPLNVNRAGVVVTAAASGLGPYDSSEDLVPRAVSFSDPYREITAGGPPKARSDRGGNVPERLNSLIVRGWNA